MQKVRNFFQSNTSLYVLLGLISIVIIVGTIDVVYGVPFAWNTNAYIPMTSETLGMHIVLDLDQNGIADTVYELNGFFLNKTFGDGGVESITLQEHTIGQNYHVLGNVKQNRISWMGTTGDFGVNNCIANGHQYNVWTGAEIDLNQMNYGAVQQPQIGQGVFINDQNNTAVYTRCGGLGNMFGVAQSPNVNVTNAAGSGAIPIIARNIIVMDVDNGFAVYTGDHRYYGNVTSYTVNSPFMHYDIATNAYLQTTAFDVLYTTNIDSTIPLYHDIFKLQNRTLSNELQKDYLNPLDSTIDIIGAMNLEDINVNFDYTDTKFLMENSTGQYYAAVNGATLEVLDYSDLLAQFVNRAYGNFRVDFDGSFLTLGIQGAKEPVQAGMYEVAPDFSTTAKSYPPQVVYPSGYGIKSSSTLNRFYMASWVNDVDNYISIKTNTGSHTELTVEIKNAFPETAIRIRDTFTYDNSVATTYVWLVDQMQTDNTITFDLVANQCVYVDIKNIVTNNDSWVELGFLCNNGLTYKILPNTSELSYQFWAFPIGANHIFNNTSNLLQTQVRSNTPPFEYAMTIHNANDVLVYDTIINSTTSIDLNTINATGWDKPLQFRVLNTENNNATVYNANLGFPSYLSGIGLFINQYLVYEGFNLVFLMPLIFMAMFTRNTVGIGTVLTVVFIATLVWFGIISIPDTILYTMMVISVIGLIAYKSLHG